MSAAVSLNPRILVLVVCLLAAPGCKLWTDPPSEKTTRLPIPRMSPDSVVLEVQFVHVPSDVAAHAEGLWQEVDEQHLPNDLRRRLQANGFRCGIVGTQLPGDLQELLNHPDNSERMDSAVGTLRVQEDSTVKRIQTRAGQRSKLVTSATHDKLVVMVTEDGKVRGQTLRQAHCEFALKAFPQGDGRVRFELTPEVFHGAPKQTYVGSDNAFRIEMQQDSAAYENLRIETTLALGQTLVLSSTADASGLGARFFADGRPGASRPKLILIRLAQTQLDDLFAPEQVSATNIARAE